MRNNRGSITIDYLFAFVLVSGFSIVVMTFSATLSMVEVVQYMTFASARNYFSGNMSEPKQQDAAQQKFAELAANPVVAPLLNGGWFSVPKNSVIAGRNFSSRPGFEAYKSSTQGASDHDTFHGVVVTFNANILNFEIPFFGSTVKSDQGGKNTGFSTKISSFVGREPSFEDCNNFNNDRWEHIKQLPNTKGAAAYSQAGSGSSGQDYVVINDNGC